MSKHDILQPPNDINRAPQLTTFKCLIDVGWFLDLPSYNDGPGTYQNFNLSYMAHTLQYAFNGSFDRCALQPAGPNRAPMPETW